MYRFSLGFFGSRLSHGAAVFGGASLCVLAACSTPPEDREYFDDLDAGAGGETATGGRPADDGGTGGSGTGGASSTGGTDGGTGGSGQCRPGGDECSEDEQCCGGDEGTALCVNFGDYSACGDYCTSDADCDSGCCVELVSGLGACAPSEDECGGPGCRGAGYVCETDADCCGGGTDAFCTDDGVGPKTCGAACDLNEDCASDCCVFDGVNTACFQAGFCGNCTDTCATANNDVCEDGGNDAIATGCVLGTDCTDCGLARQNVCDNSCETRNDGVCDDGGLFSVNDTCEIGSDCGDCGPFGPGIGGVPYCDVSCTYSGDGACDDGRPGAAWDVCELGTDCIDCGGFVVTDGCDDSCATAGNGVCEHGRFGETGACEPGTDCSDCGPVGSMYDVCEDTCGDEDGVPNDTCDDGGPGSASENCPIGSDCSSCGPRTVFCFDYCPKARNGVCEDSTHDALDDCAYGFDCSDCGPRGPTSCTDDCTFAEDGVCDDGGPGSESDLCPTGTDCADCGAR